MDFIGQNKIEQDLNIIYLQSISCPIIIDGSILIFCLNLLFFHGDVKGVKLIPGKKYMLQITVKADNSETANIYFKSK